MNFSEILSGLIVPVGIGILLIIVLLLLRLTLYRYIRRMVVKSRTKLDDILIRGTRLATLLWCIWLGIFAAFVIYESPESWAGIANAVIPAVFTALGIYTAITIIMALLRWYKKEVCCRTSSSLDDIIVETLVICTPIVGGILGIITILNMLGMGSAAVNNWLNAHLVGLAAITIVTVALLLLSVVFIPRIIETAVHNSRADQTEEELQKRTSTLVSVIGATVQVTIIFIYILMIASNAGLNVTSILAGAGVVGIAVGFGAQSLVKDILAGLFVIMENQYRKGDVVSIAGVTGTVEDINLRRTLLRDVDGISHVVPNGEIRTASNYTKQWARANFNVSVAFDTDLNKAMEIINGVGKEMVQDTYWATAVISPPKAIRVDKLGVDSGIEIRVMADTQPSRQWEVMGELRLRLKNAFDKEGIELYIPHRRLSLGNGSPCLEVGKPVSDTEEKNRKLNN